MKSVTLRNMASVTIKRLPGGAVAVTGRKLGGTGRANPGRKASRQPWYDVIKGGYAIGPVYTSKRKAQAFAAKMNRKEPGTATVRTTR